jgi:tRNA(fMet)-specific endonuclease VapC
VYILDTDTLTLVHADHSKVTERRREVPSADVAISIVTRIEMLRGRIDFMLKADDGAQLLRAQALFRQTEDRLARITTIPFDAVAAAEFDRLRVAKVAAKIGRADLLIASIALARRATLVTRNLRHFRQVPGLTLDDWSR